MQGHFESSSYLPYQLDHFPFCLIFKYTGNVVEFVLINIKCLKISMVLVAQVTNRREMVLIIYLLYCPMESIDEHKLLYSLKLR
jgi:hypothetical protein